MSRGLGECQTKLRNQRVGPVHKHATSNLAFQAIGKLCQALNKYFRVAHGTNIILHTKVIPRLPEPLNPYTYFRHR